MIFSKVSQACANLHTMSILQEYKADLQRNLDDDEGVGSDAVRELCLATDLSLRATKETTGAIGRSMSALVATERHLWLNLFDIKDKGRAFLLDAPL